MIKGRLRAISRIFPGGSFLCNFLNSFPSRFDQIPDVLALKRSKIIFSKSGEDSSKGAEGRGGEGVSLEPPGELLRLFVTWGPRKEEEEDEGLK